MAQDKSTNIYFATESPDVLAGKVREWADDFYNFLVTTGRWYLYANVYLKYYRASYSGGSLMRSGDQGQYTVLNVNHLRNLLQHLLSLTTSQRPAFEPQATNTDAKSAKQTVVASVVLDYYNKEKKIDDILDRGVKYTLQYGDAYVTMDWDATLGDVDKQKTENAQLLWSANPTTPPPEPIKQGDIAINVFTPIDVIYDFTAGLNNVNERKWYIVREYVNKYDLAAKFPQHAEKIKNTTDDCLQTNYLRKNYFVKRPPEVIPVYKFYHMPTPALPKGRMFTCISQDCWLTDGDLPYEKMPVFRMCAEEQENLSMGYTTAFDLLPIQETIDALNSTIATNQENFGVQNVLAPIGSNMTPQQIAGGLNLLYFNPINGAKPEALNLTDTPAEIFNFLQMLVKDMETISGVNSVARGNPESSLKSGAALALVQSMAIQFANSLNKMYAHTLEEVGTFIIQLLKQFADTPRMIEIAGKSNTSNIQAFKNDDLSSISRVTVNMGNPLSRVIAGRYQIAQDLMQMGGLTPRQYLNFTQTGRLENMTEGTENELILIKSENEALSSGQAQTAVVTDNHIVHILEHKSVFASSESRADANVVQMTMDHIQQHINLLRTSDPFILQMLGQPVPPPMMPPPTPAAGAAGAVQNPQNPNLQVLAAQNGPSMPTNPLTHQKFNPVTGGL